MMRRLAPIFGNIRRGIPGPGSQKASASRARGLARAVGRLIDRGEAEATEVIKKAGKKDRTYGGVRLIGTITDTKGA